MPFSLFFIDQIAIKSMLLTQTGVRSNGTQRSMFGMNIVPHIVGTELCKPTSLLRQSLVELRHLHTRAWQVRLATVQCAVPRG